MKETRKIEIELSNKTRQTAECTISKFCEESPTATVRVKYSYQYRLLIRSLSITKRASR